MYLKKKFLFLLFLFIPESNADNLKKAIEKSSLIKVNVKVINESRAIVNINNIDVFPHIVLVKIFNSWEPDKIISEISATVSEKDSVSLEAQSNSNLHFDYPAGWRYFEVIGDTRKAIKDYQFQLPFLPNYKFKICQSSDGPQSTHSEDKIHAIDFCSSEKTPIAAAKDGVAIEIIDTNTGKGNNQNLLGSENKIRLLHDDGLISEYAHISAGSANIKVGDKVKAGQQIALLGNVGFSTGPHLHFEVTEGSLKLTTRKLLDNVMPVKFINSNHQEIKIKYGATYTINGETSEDNYPGRLLPPVLNF